MRIIYLHYLDMQGGKVFDPSIRDNSNDPFIALQRRLKELGYELRTLDDHPLTGAEWVLFFNADSVLGPDLKQRIARHVSGQRLQFPRRDVYRECIGAGLQHRMALFLWEPPSVMPRNYDPGLHARIPVIFTWHDGYADGSSFHKITIPQPHRFPMVPRRPFDAKKLLVNISANKYSRHPRELYSERRKAIRHFEQVRPAEFDLFGFGWNKPVGIAQRIFRYTPPPYTSYRGSVMHKWDVFPRYRFALCYENVGGEPGYISEKIFDCMRADCVPVYWGAPNVEQYIPSAAFVDRRRFSSNRELEMYLANMPEAEYESYRSAIDTFLAGDSFARFSEEAFVDQVIRVLRLQAAA